MAMFTLLLTNLELIGRKKSRKIDFEEQTIGETLQREISIHRKLKHQYIVRVYMVLEDIRQIYLIMDYIPRGNLF